MGEFRLALVVDIASRLIVGWQLLRHQKTDLVLDALKMALKHFPAPEIMHTDQGSVYLSEAHLNLLQKFKVRLSCSKAGEPIENPFSERLGQTIKFHLGSITGLSYRQVYELLAGTIYYYNHQRWHSILKMPPFKYYCLLNNRLPQPFITNEYKHKLSVNK